MSNNNQQGYQQGLNGQGFTPGASASELQRYNNGLAERQRREALERQQREAHERAMANQRDAARRQTDQQQHEAQRRRPDDTEFQANDSPAVDAMESDAEPLPWQFWLFGLIGAFYVGVLANAIGYHWLLGSGAGFLGLGVTGAWLRKSPVGRRILWTIAVAAVGALALSIAFARTGSG